MTSNLKLAKILRYIARTFLVIVSVFWFVFALLSGAEEYGGGLMGIVKNSPNALPWLLLFVFVYLSFKWELIGGIIISLLGVFSFFAFDVSEQMVVFFFIPLPLFIFGAFLIASYFLSKKKAK